MNPKLRPYAWVGLALAGAAAAFSLTYYFLYRKFDLGIQVGIGVVVIGLAMYALLDPQKLREIFTGRQMKYGSNMVIFAIAILGILVVLNVLANKYGPNWDFTEDKTNTLSKETIQVLQALPGKVQVTGFFTKNNPSDTAKSILDNMKHYANGKLDYRFIDPDNDPVTTKTYGITSDGTLVLEMDNRQQSVKAISEEEIATALIKISNPKSSVVYFLTGHGEHDITTTENNGMTIVNNVLTKKNYTVKQLNLLTENKIPDDAAVLVVAGPTKPISADEMTKIKEFVSKGKSLVVMEDSPITNDLGTSGDPMVEYLKSDWGITMGNDLILDLGTSNLAQAIANEYGDHPIVNRLARIITTFPNSRSVTAANPAPDGITLTELVKTSKNSWAETDFAALKQNKYQPDEGVDMQGPVPVAVAGANSTSKARVVVIGSSNFAIDNLYNSYGNGDFIINSIDWAAENESLINLTPRNVTNRVIVPPSTLAMSVIFLVSVIAFPLLILVAGITVWIQRRKRG
jgi:ABC-type uncharacterized transport system involved in gliding motility auxiliary subunit